MVRSRDYPIVRFLIGSLYAIGILSLLSGLAGGAYLWVHGEALQTGVLAGGPFASALKPFKTSGQLYQAAAVVAGAGLVGFLLFGAFGQILAIQRDRAINASLQTQLLEDILELNEEITSASRQSRVEICEGCGRLGSLHRIESGQWVCRVCRLQLRTA
jgi:hypothetical protein